MLCIEFKSINFISKYLIKIHHLVPSLELLLYPAATVMAIVSVISRFKHTLNAYIKEVKSTTVSVSFIPSFNSNFCASLPYSVEYKEK